MRRDACARAWKVPKERNAIARAEIQGLHQSATALKVAGRNLITPDVSPLQG
jgi:hypothetical protein